MSEVNYSIALRCIAQDLERRGLKTFVIKRDGSHFVVIPRAQTDSPTVSAGVRYTPSDIEIIDRSGETRRGGPANQEFLHRAQILRAIGDYLDKYGSTLICITYNDVERHEPLLRVEYITREGEHVTDDRPGAAIFDECVLMFQKRSQTAGTSHRGSRSQA